MWADLSGFIFGRDLCLRYRPAHPLAAVFVATKVSFFSLSVCVCVCNLLTYCLIIKGKAHCARIPTAVLYELGANPWGGGNRGPLVVGLAGGGGAGAGKGSGVAVRPVRGRPASTARSRRQRSELPGPCARPGPRLPVDVNGSRVQPTWVLGTPPPPGPESATGSGEALGLARGTAAQGRIVCQC